MDSATACCRLMNLLAIGPYIITAAQPDRREPVIISPSNPPRAGAPAQIGPDDRNCDRQAAKLGAKSSARTRGRSAPRGPVSNPSPISPLPRYLLETPPHFAATRRHWVE